MAIKFNLPKKDIKTGNSSIASTGGYNKSASSNKNSAYVGSSTANMPVTKNAQMAGSGASVIWTQPMFFSPLHTPQNWQIASKRREVYQWSFISPCNIASYDGSLRDISEIFEEMAIPTSSYISGKDEVQDGYGNMVCPDKSSKRWINKKANKITVTGLPESLTVTHDHKCMIIRRENAICKYHNKKFCVSGATRSSTCERAKCYKSDNKSYDITTVDAQDVLVGDFALIPFNTEIKESIIKTIEEARYAGHLASDGWVCNGSTKSGYKVAGICMNTEEKEYVMPAIASVYEDRDSSLEYMEQNSAGTLLMTRNSSSKVYDFALQLICGKSSTKKFTDQVLYLHPDLQRHVLGAYIQSDGTYNKANDVYEITTYSKHLANQLLSMSFRCGILARLNKQPLSSSKSTFDSKNEFRYILNIPSSECSKISEYVPGKSKNMNARKKGCSWRFFWKNFVVSRVRSNESFDYEGYVYDIRVPGTFTVTANNIAAHQCRFYYDNEPKVAAGVDFYSIFPMNGFTLECKNKRVLKYFEKISKRLRINYWLKLISHEYFLLGDVFPFLEISCPHCGGSGTLKTGEMCNHSGGTVKRIVVLNPDWIEVQTNVLANEPVVALVPDDELRMIVQRKQPKQIYDKLPKKLIELIASGMPISLSNRCVSHIKHNASPYGIYGTAMLRRLFTVLAYKTKLMTANWIVAERLILPVRVVKIGDKDRPASPEDISDVSSQLAAVANDPNLTLVTHHAFSYEWYGACYSDDTEVLTENGWKLFRDLNRDERVATYNQETGYMEYDKPIEYYEYDFKSNEFMKMYRFNHRSVDVLVTPNHRMLVERNGKMTETYSQDIKHDDKFISTVNWMGEYPVEMPHMKSCLSHLPLHDYLEFAGYYISEGGAKEEKNRGLSESKIIQACSISQNKSGKYYNDIRTSVALVYPNFSEYEDKRNSGCSYMTINSVNIARYLSEEFGSHSHNKRIPKWIKDLPKHRLEIILKSLLKGDGGTRGRESLSRYTYTTTSKQLADDVSEICLKLGYFTTIGEEEPKNGNCRKVYKVYWSENRKDTKFNIRKKNITQEEYSGKVYCVKVPNSWLVTRRNGRISVQGNSGKIQSINTELEYVGKEILDGLMLNQALLNGEMAGYCHSEDTLTLTDSGFKHYLDITEKDKIACYNPDTKTMEYHHYDKKHIYDFDGEMVKFSTDKIDMLVTPNHRMYVQPRDKDGFDFVEAKDVRRRTKTIGSVESFDGDSMSVVKIGEEEYSIFDFCEMVGFYVSEGYTSKCRGKTKNFAICQSEKGKGYVQISSLFERVFDKYHYSKGKQFITYNDSLSNYFKENFGQGSTNKTIPSWVKNLSTEYLDIIINSMVLGDGCIREYAERKLGNMSYDTTSHKLAIDLMEMAFKCGYSVSLSEREPRKSDNVNKTGHKFCGNYKTYTVYMSKGFKGKYPVLESKKPEFAGKEITREYYKGKTYCFTVPHGLFVTMRNGKITIQGNSSAQVGVEVMIRRLDSWRHELAEWVENHIFLPIAMMQGFIDEEESEDMGETVYLTPTVEWNDLNLRDTSNIKQMFIALHDKKLVSSQTLLDQFDVDYDQEIEKIREETIAVGAQGQMGAPGGGSPMGGMPPGGGGGGAPGGPPPGAPPGGDMAGGAPMGGDMAGGAAAGGAPPGGAPMGATAGSTAMSPGFKISKRGKGKNPAEAAQEQQPQSIRISLTKLEQKMYKVLIGMGLPYKTYAQYKVAVAGQQQPFVIDFAMPEIGIGIETDGAQWHEQAEAKAKDQQRDQKLAGLGWRILRFREKAIEDRMNEVQNIISQNIETASKYRKKAAADGTMIKEASINFDNIDLNDIVITKESMGDDLGDIFIIGVADNG